MRPELFRIPVPFTDRSIPILGFGLMLVLGFFAVLQVAKYLGRRTRIDPEHFVNVTFMCLAFGVLGARVSHVVENWHEYWRPDLSILACLEHMINLREGGLTYYGGFALATVVCIAYALWKRLPLRLGMDIVAICLMIGLGFGRIGCFLNGCCYGKECSLPWAVQFPFGSYAYDQQWRDGRLSVPDALYRRDGLGGARLFTRAELRDPVLKELAAQQRSRGVHPAQLYSAFTAFLLAGLLFAYFTLPHAPGRVFALMLLLEGTARFLLELLRTEKPVWGDLTVAQVTGLVLVPAGMAMWIVCGQLATRAGWEDDRWRGFAPIANAAK